MLPVFAWWIARRKARERAQRNLVFAAPNEPLEDYLFRSDGVQRAPILVRDESGKLLGMVTMENVMEFLTLRQITPAPPE